MRYSFSIVFVILFFAINISQKVYASENGMMSTFGETTFLGMNGVMETNFVEEMQAEQDFNGIRTEIEPQSAQTARGLNGVMDVFDPNTDALASAQLIAKKAVDVPALKMEFLYPVNGSELTAADKVSLGKVVDLLRRGQLKTIYLVGYTDPTGNLSYNQALSLKRAQKVAQWLVNNGVPSDKIQTLGAGIDHLQEDFSMARRVELSILLK